MSFEPAETETRLRDALRAAARGVEPDEAAGLHNIRGRLGRARTRRRATWAGVGLAAAVVAGLVIVPLLDDDGTEVRTGGPSGTETTTTTTSTSTSTTATTATTAVVAPSSIAAVWPPDDHAPFDDPVSAARSFMVEYVGLDDPTFSTFREGEPRVGEIDVYTVGESGTARNDDVASTISLRQVGGHWAVTSAQSDEILLTSPDALATVDSPLTVSGRGHGFEALILVTLREAGMGADDFLAREPAMGGCCEALEPFSVDVAFDPPSTATGSLLLEEGTGLEGGLTDFTVIPLRFG